jgi:hypothetical protein
MNEPGTDLETALKRFAAWKHYRGVGAVLWENDELKDGMLIFEAYAALETDKADLLRVLGIADEKIRSGEDARGQYIREIAALEARCRAVEEEYAEYRACEKPEAEAAEKRIAELEYVLRRIAASHGASDHGCFRRDLADQALTPIETF